MIIFQTDYQEIYNYIIHNFLDIEIFDHKEVHEDPMGDMIEFLLPIYLYREQFFKCKKVFQELFDWTEDSFYHQMSAFHELVLYRFIEYMKDVQNDCPNFEQIYFDEKIRLLIKKAGRERVKKDEDISLEKYAEEFYDVSGYPDFLFTDTDFLMIDLLYNYRTTVDAGMEERLGINIDYYFELLPRDIQERYRTNHLTLSGEVSALLDYIEDRIQNGNLYKLFWEKDSPVKEERIQLILENIMDAYFYNQEIEITREALLGSGRVDFKLYRNSREDEKVLIEIKRASSSYLKKGYENQLTEYMRSSKYKNAFYLIACFTDDEYEKSERFIREHVYTDTIQLYINIAILDFRKRKTASIS